MQKVNTDAKAYVRSTFMRNDGLFITYIAALHSWRYKEADVWTRLFELNRSLASKKPPGSTVRDWRNKLDRWRVERRTLAHSDIDSDNDHIWMMRVLESVSHESWYKKLRKDIAHDERRGIFIESTDAMWEKLEFEETWIEDSSQQGELRVSCDEIATKLRVSIRISSFRTFRLGPQIRVACLWLPGRAHGPLTSTLSNGPARGSCAYPAAGTRVGQPA